MFEPELPTDINAKQEDMRLKHLRILAECTQFPMDEYFVTKHSRKLLLLCCVCKIKVYHITAK